MTMYTFFCCLPGGAAPAFEAHELASDADAAARADRLLGQHASCSHVAVYDGERAVLTRLRETAPGEPAPRPDWPAISKALTAVDAPRNGAAVIVTDPDGAVVFWNQAATKLYGWTPADALGADILNVTPSIQSKRKAKAIMQSLKAGEPWEGEIVLKRRNGTLFEAYVADTPVGPITEQGGVIVGVSAPAEQRHLVWQAQAEILAQLQREGA